MAEDISEALPPVRRRDASFFLVLFFFVGPIFSIVPASWIYVIHSLTYWRLFTYSHTKTFLFLYALCEVLFNLYYLYLSRKISGPSPNLPQDALELNWAYQRALKSGLTHLPEDRGGEEYYSTDRPGSPDAVIEQLQPDDPRAIDFRNRLRTWFKRVPWSRVRRDHFHQWLYWSAYNATLPPKDQIPKAHKVLLDEATGLMEKRIGRTIPEGSDPSVQVLRLTIDPINVLPRPLILFLFVKVANWYITTKYEMKYGLIYGRYRDLEYLYRIPPGYDRAKGPDPIVFIHGLGLGIWQYQRVLQHFLSELPDTPLLVPIQPQISQDFFHPRFLKPMLRHEKVACLAGVLDRLGWAGPSVDEKYGITLISHSNGSYNHAWMLKAFAHIVKRSCFIDPVVFCLWEGDVCYNFVYRPCTTGTELVIRYFVGTELGVANLVQRHFDWLGNTLWFEEIPNARVASRSLFLLGGKDSILDAQRVKKYLVSHGVKEGLLYYPDARHGQALLIGKAGINKIVAWIRSGNCKN